MDHPRPPAPLPEVADRLERAHPDARTALAHTSAFELLVATVLSAQTTDQRVNTVTPALMSRFGDPSALAAADEAEVARILHPLGMGPTRASRIIRLARSLLEEHGGEVPDDQDALELLPGVGRKTALVVRGVWFGHRAFAVDTHVGRLARRLGWTDATAPRRVEEDVVGLARRTGAAIDLTQLSLRLILHGREVCHSRSPRCDACALADLCPSRGIA